MLLSGSAGGGKSRLAAEKVHSYCLKYPGSSAAVLRKVRAVMANSTLLFLKRQVIGNDPRVKHKQSDFRFEYDNGSILMYGGMKDDDQRERIRSAGQDGGLDIVWMEEAIEFEEEDYNEVTARMRGRAADWSQIILTTNPDAPGHWINVRLIQGNEASVHYSGAIDNKYNPEDYVKKTLEKLTGVQYRRLALGEWTVGSGVVIDTWLDRYSRETGDDGGGNVTESAEYIPDGGSIVWGIDDGYSGKMDAKTRMFTGRSHPRAIILAQVRANGTLAVFAEHLAIEKLAHDHILAVQQMCRNRGWPDKPSHVIRDRAAASLEGTLKEFNIRCRYNQVPVDESVKELRQWVAADHNGVRKVTVHPRCFYTRYQMQSYSLDKDGGIIKEHDDTTDAIRYIVWDMAFGRSGRVDVATYSQSRQLEYNYG